MEYKSPSFKAEAAAIARLQANVRWLTALCTFLSLGFLGLVAWQFVPRSAEVQARRFVLRDDQWRRRAELSFRDDGGPALRIYNAEGRTRATMYVGENGAGMVRLTDRNGVDRIRLGPRRDGSAALILTDATGQPSVTTSADSVSLAAEAPPSGGGPP